MAGYVFRTCLCSIMVLTVGAVMCFALGYEQRSRIAVASWWCYVYTGAFLGLLAVFTAMWLLTREIQHFLIVRADRQPDRWVYVLYRRNIMKLLCII